MIRLTKQRNEGQHPMVEADGILELSQQLLTAIDEQDWATYEQLCDHNLTAFEPEAKGQLVTGMPFHKFYFETPSPNRCQSSMVSPRVKFIGDAALVTYVRLTQVFSGEKQHATCACEETRVWGKQNGDWKHIHFHRSVQS
jgi:hypothetical protein